MDFAQEGDKSGSIASTWHFSSAHYVLEALLFIHHLISSSE